MRMVLSCISYQHSSRKQEWAKAKENSNRPSNVLGRLEKPPEERDGYVYIIDELGSILNSTNIWMPTGILPFREHLFITSPWSIHKSNLDLSRIDQDVYSMPWFNGLHSIVRTRGGFLITSTGLDLLLEIDQDGKFLWSWWALDHGLDLTPLGKQRYINRSADHRGYFYGTASQTTHINSAVELANGDILASLFHQGMIIYIDRKSGEWKPILEGLDHPHFIRLQSESSFTVADTGRGRALLVKILSNQKSHIEKEVNLNTIWLADCFYDEKKGMWLLLDGDNSHVVIFNENSENYSHLIFDPELRLYSLEPMY